MVLTCDSSSSPSASSLCDAAAVAAGPATGPDSAAKMGWGFTNGLVPIEVGGFWGYNQRKINNFNIMIMSFLLIINIKYTYKMMLYCILILTMPFGYLI